MLKTLLLLLSVSFLLTLNAFAQDETRLLEAYRHIPLRFEPNVGQTNTEVKFLSRQRGFDLFLTTREAVMILAPRPTSPHSSNAGNHVFRLTWIDGNPKSRMEATDELAARSNYFLGNDEARWQTDVPNYGRVRYHDIYPGVDLVYYGQQDKLEYDLIVRPHAHAEVIRFGIAGASKAFLDTDGNLILDVGGEQFELRKPVIYQPGRSGNRQLVAGRYLLNGREVRVGLGKYDHTLPLIIDPHVVYSSYVGGSGDDIFQKVAIDSQGNAYAIGFTRSLDFPRAIPFQGQLPDTSNVVVSKLNPALSGAGSLIFSTYLGGSGNSVGRGIAVDSQGQIYIGGDTSVTNFPATAGAYSTTCKTVQPGQCSSDTFAAKLNAAGNGLIYSTYMGGTGTEFAFSLAIDPAGHMFLTGPTDSTDLPVTSGAVQTSISQGPATFRDTFIAKINPAGGGASDLQYLTYLGGGGSEQSWSIAVDGGGDILVTGSTTSSDFPVTVGAYQRTYAGAGSLQLGDAFVAKVHPAGQGNSDLLYSTYLGGADDDRGEAIAVDSSNLVYVTGLTASSNFPIVQATAYRTTFGGGNCLGAPCADAFIVKLNPSAQGAASLVYSTFFGGNSFDLGHAIAVDGFGHVYVAGETASTNFPLQDPIQASCTGGCLPVPLDDAFVAKFDLTKPGTAGLLFSTYLGGNDVDTAWGIAADLKGNAYVVGHVFSTDFPTIFPYQAFCNNCTSFTANPRRGDGLLFKVCTDGCTVANVAIAARGANKGTTLGTGSLQAGYAKATIQSGGPPYGVAVFSLRKDGTIISEAGVPASTPTRSARLFVDYRTQALVPPLSLRAGPVDIATGIAIVNPGTALANITFTLHDTQGTVLTVGHGTLAAGDHRARYIYEFRELAPDFVIPPDFATRIKFGSLEIASDQPLSILALRLTVNQRSETLLTTIPVADMSQPTSSGPLFFPHIVDGGGFSTSVILLNTTNNTQSGTIRFYNESGLPFSLTSGGVTNSVFSYSIVPGATYLLQTEGTTPGISVGSAQLFPNAGSTSPVGAGVFSMISGGVLASESGIPSAIPTTHARVFVDLTGGHDSGLAIAATNATAIPVTLQAFQNDGITPVGNVTTRSLAGNGHIAAFASEFITNLPPNFAGVLDVSAPTAFVALTLRTLFNARNDFLMTTFPVADLASPAPPVSPLIFPQIADGGGFVTDYILISAGGASGASVSFLSDAGSLLAIGK